MFRGHTCAVTQTVAFAVLGWWAPGLAAQTTETISPTYLPEQAAAGEPLYQQHCSSCHGANLDGGQFAPALKGDLLAEKWGGKSVAELFDYTKTRMPPTAPDSLGAKAYLEILAYILQGNNSVPGKEPIAEGAKMVSMIMPSPMHPNGRLAAGVVLPPPPTPLPNPLADITPVTDELLHNPPDGAWLSWRRTAAGGGFSPLKQIDKTNIEDVRLAWSWALGNGPNEATPLVHDGVMFAYSYPDRVQALNAKTGDLLWQYARKLPADAFVWVKRAIAIYDDKIYFPTADSRVVALDVKTGNVVWETLVMNGEKKAMMSGGPLIAKGKLLIGTSGIGGLGGAIGGGQIVALDARTGKQAWEFRVIPRPGTREGDSWNDLAYEKRSGGSVWTPGSYDPELNLAYFGSGPTYDTKPLISRIKGSKHTNDALYTNATVALNPDTGELVWYYQHLANDQWDLDWAFERQIVNVAVNGKEQKLVVTSGKPAIYDAVQAATGKYAFSIDLGLQNFVKKIDPKTGRKTIDATLVPGDGQDKFVCPHAEGGKNWTPGSYDPQSKFIFTPLVESCMWLYPGTSNLFSTGVVLTLAPRPNSDGLFGRLEAIDLNTRKSAWVHRQRAPLTMGVLATAGGLVFTGGMDRVFAAFDAANGNPLWSVRLDDVPNSNAISYAVDGKQYIAVISGNGGVHANLFGSLTPEIMNPPNRSSTVWVFELPER